MRWVDRLPINRPLGIGKPGHVVCAIAHPRVIREAEKGRCPADGATVNAFARSLRLGITDLVMAGRGASGKLTGYFANSDLWLVRRTVGPAKTISVELSKTTHRRESRCGLDFDQFGVVIRGGARDGSIAGSSQFGQ
jgi:hypothetical protein